MTTVKSQAEWMALHLEELIEAIKADGKLGGRKSEPLLDRCSRYSTGAKVARHMLETRLRAEGLVHLMLPDETVSVTPDRDPAIEIPKEE